MIRLIILLLAIIVFLIVTLPVLFILYLIGKKKPDVRLNCSSAIIRWVMKMILLLAGAKVTVIGKERIPEDTACLFVGNHRSIFDIPLAYVHLPKSTHIIAKQELSKIPLFRNWAHSIGVLFFDRENPKAGMKMILDGIKIMKGGNSVLVYAEGTRNKAEADLPLLEFHEGTFRLASKSGCPIVPVSVNNSKNILEAHFPWVKSTRIVIEFGEPIYPDDIPADQKRAEGAYVREIITGTIEKNAALLKQ